MTILPADVSQRADVGEAFPFVVVASGTAGVRVAAEFWKLVCASHKFDHTRHDFELKDAAGHAGIMFGPRPKQGIAARTILVDTETSETSAIKRDVPIIRPESIVQGEGGGAKNYGDGRLAFDELKPEIEESFDQIVGKVENLHGVLHIHSVGGGTGSGLGSKLTTMIRQRQKRTLIASAIILPDPEYDPVRDPFASTNAILALADLLQSSDLVILFDNYAIRQIMAEEEVPVSELSKLRARIMKLRKTPEHGEPAHMYEGHNVVMADFLERLTSVFRFRTGQGFDWKETIIYSCPRKHDKLVIPMSYPMIPGESAEDAISAASGCLDGAHHLVNCTLKEQKASSCVFLVDGRVNEDDIRAVKIETKNSCTMTNERQIAVVPGRLDFHVSRAIGLLNTSAVSKRIDDFAKQTEDMLETEIGLAWYEDSGVHRQEIEQKLSSVRKALERYYNYAASSTERK